MGRLGPFEVLEQTGHGSVATVWRGRHVETGVPVAIKVVTLGEAAKESHVYRFRAEVRSIARIAHGGVVRIYDEGILNDIDVFGGSNEVVDGSPYIVMEWAEHGNLWDRAGYLDWAELRTILLSLLESLAAVHARGIIHRDIKPRNILFAGRGLLLADFGVAYESDAETEDPHLQKTLGSPNYMAPEQVLCRWRDYGPWTDLYAVGCLSWFLATGQAPFERDTSRAVLQAQIKARLPHFLPLFDVPPGFEQWCARLLAKNPFDRFAFAADAAHELMRLDPSASAKGTETIGNLFNRPMSSQARLSGTGLSCTPGLGKDSGGTQGSPPPVDPNWRRVEPAPSEEALTGAGLTVFSDASSGFVGREHERDLLWRALQKEQVSQGHQSFIISGSAGSGKSALTKWFLARAHETGAAYTLVAKHARGEDGLSALRRMVEGFFRSQGLDGNERQIQLQRRLNRLGAGQLEPELNAFVDQGQRTALDKQNIALVSQKERFVILCNFIEALCHQRALIIVLDDVQWGDIALQWLSYAQENKFQLSVVWVLTWRDNAPGASLPAMDLLTGISTDKRCVRIALDRLEYADARALITSRIKLDRDSLNALLERSEGNPLFAEQLVEHWIRTDSLVRTESGFRVRDTGTRRLPDSVHELWQERLENLGFSQGDDRQWTLEIAATLGQRFAIAHLAEACKAGAVEFDRGLVPALEQYGLLLLEADGRYAFVHALLCESIHLQGRDAHRGRRWHRACAEALAQLEPVSWYRVAQYYRDSGAYEEAARALVKEIDVRRTIGDLDGQVEWLAEMARCLWKAKVASDDSRWGYLRIRWSYAQRMRGDPVRSLRFARAAKRRLDRVRQPELYADASLSEGLSTKFVHDHHAALPIIADAIKVAEQASDRSLEFEIRRLYSVILREVGREEASADEFKRIDDLYHRGWLDALTPMARNAVRTTYFLERCQQAWLAGRLDEAVNYAYIAQTLAEELGGRGRVAFAAMLRARVLLQQGRYEEALRDNNTAHDTLALVGHTDRFTAAGFAVVSMMQLGQYEEAIDRHREVLDGLRSVDRPLSARLGGPFVLGALARLGRWDEWELSFRDLADLVETSGYAAMFARVVELSAAHCVEVGAFSRAERLCRLLRTAYESQDAPADVARIDSILETLP